MPRPPIDPTIRAAIIADFTTDKARNQIARDHRVSASTVTKIAQEVGHEFDRTATKHATAAAVVDNKARRAAISRKFLEKADRLLDQMEQPHIVFNIGGKDNVYTEHLMDAPPTADIRNLMTSAAIALDKHMAADKHDSDDQGLAAVDEWLRTMLGSS